MTYADDIIARMGLDPWRAAKVRAVCESHLPGADDLLDGEKWATFYELLALAIFCWEDAPAGDVLLAPMIPPGRN